MNFGDLELVLGWREALIGVIALLALYMLVVVRRLRRLRQPPVEDSPVAPVLPADPPVPAFESAPSPVEPGTPEPDFPWNEPPEPPSSDERFAAVAAELAQVRTEVTMLRGELAALREEMKQQVERVEASQHVAPIYGDAMQMALAGHDAAAIAERCGVARAEAELVVALIRNRDAERGENGSESASRRSERMEPTMRDR